MSWERRSSVTVAPYLAVGSTAATMLMGLLLCAAVPFRRRVPSLALAIGLTGAAGHLILLTQPTLSLIVVPIRVYSIARWGERRLGRTTFGFALLGSLLGPVRWAMLRRSRRRSDQRRLSLGAAESQHH